MAKPRTSNRRLSPSVATQPANIEPPPSTSGSGDDAAGDVIRREPRPDPTESQAWPSAAARYPLSARATPDQVRQAGIVNGMSAEAIEAALARVMR